MHLTSTQNAEIEFSFKPYKNLDLNKVSLMQYKGFKEKTFKIYDLKNEDGLIKFKYKFKYKKLYDVHLKIDDDIVATYTVNVTSE
jgi:hypothetical protein